MRKIIFLVCIALTLSAAVSNALAQQNDIRKIDFKNFTYQPFCLGEESQDVKIKDGSFSEEKEVEDGFKERFYFSAEIEEFADVDGDGKEEALISSVCNTGGTGNFTEGFIYAMRDGKPFLLARIPGGDRAYGGIDSIRMEDKYLVVERYSPGEKGGACCPVYLVKNRYKVRGADLIDVGTPVKCEMYPAFPIEFDRGKSATSFKLILPPNDSIRFEIQARAGQTLRVANGSKAIYARVIEGEAETVSEGQNLTAKLQKKGKYIFELNNSESDETEFTVTVEIK